MEPFMWLAVMAAGLVLVVAGVLVLHQAMGKRKEPDYRALFVMGLVFTLSGIPSVLLHGLGGIAGYSPLLALGVIYSVTGLANYRKWKRPHKMPRKNEIEMVALLVLTFLLVGLTVLVAMVQP